MAGGVFGIVYSCQRLYLFLGITVPIVLRVLRLLLCGFYDPVPVVRSEINEIPPEQVSFAHLKGGAGVPLLVHIQAGRVRKTDHPGVFRQVVGLHPAHRVDPLKPIVIAVHTIWRLPDIRVLIDPHAPHSRHRLGVAALVIGVHIGHGVHGAGAHPLEARGVGGGEHIGLPAKHPRRPFRQLNHLAVRNPGLALRADDGAVVQNRVTVLLG